MVALRSRLMTSPWERAYLAFEAPHEEEEKFIKRFLSLGARNWDRGSLVLDLFCGRGGGGRALRRLGFRRIIGVDVSATLQGINASENRAIADCRALPVASQCADIAIVQGGLHHLPHLAKDLSATLTEVARALRPGGLLVAVEPWRTPFLDSVHWICKFPIARKMIPKIDALATMIEHERVTYETWLENGSAILAELHRHFEQRQLSIRLGKLYYVGVRH
jgi:SAM-dependent methyltransferase